MLSKNDVDKMVREAQEHAEEDKQRREEVETRNQAEQLTYQAERTLADLGDKVSAEDRAEVETKVSGLREGPQGHRSIELIKSGAPHSLAQTLSRVGTAAYQASAAGAGSGSELGRPATGPAGARAALEVLRERRGKTPGPVSAARAPTPARARRRSSQTSGRSSPGRAEGAAFEQRPPAFTRVQRGSGRRYPMLHDSHAFSAASPEQGRPREGSPVLRGGPQPRHPTEQMGVLNVSFAGGGVTVICEKGQPQPATRSRS